MGNEAIGLGALAAGVRVVTGYPGTPSSEILPTVSANNPGNIHVEWSVNEKVALEVAAGAAMAGARSMVTMKQVGLNVAADPLMSLAYLGVKGGMVVVVADDPGPISSQTEQDTRTFGLFSKLPVFDPASPEEAYEMVIDAFELSERFGTPVLFRPTTRVCHGNAPVTLRDTLAETPGSFRFIKDSRWVIFPRLSYQNHIKMEQRLPVIADELSGYRFNTLSGAGRIGIVTQGISSGYVGEALAILGNEVPAHKLLRVATPHPFPKRLALEFLDGLDQVLVVEELDPYLERELQRLAGEKRLQVTVLGKTSGHMPPAGENTVAVVTQAIAGFFGLPAPSFATAQPADAPALPARPPVLCAGCSHRSAYIAVKRAMRKRRAVFSGDIGCYTLGNAEPLNMVDTCLCMGAGITMAQGLHVVEPGTVHFAFIGDSTFFHSGITGVINAVYNRTPIVVVVLDNATTAMTGLQPHPGTGDTMMGSVSQKVDIATVLRGLGVPHVEKCDPLKLEESMAAVTRAADATANGVAALIFESPCIHVALAGENYVVDADKCECKECIIKLGCPAIMSVDGKAWIDNDLCFGCDLCLQICKFDAIRTVPRTGEGR